MVRRAGLSLIFVMVSTARSVAYTEAALQSLYRNTTFDGADEVVLISNEPGALPDFARSNADTGNLTVMEHAAPEGFAKNMNIGVEMAIKRHADLVCLNNDIIFTAGWLDGIRGSHDEIVLPVCNQQYQYESEGLNLSFFMTMEGYGGRHIELERAARRHREITAGETAVRELLMSFYCAYIPRKILLTLGPFDDLFGFGGAEDVDYRLRALLAGFDVRYATGSYVLHFMGQSTWRSGEGAEQTTARDSHYRRRFVEKWGTAMAAVFLAGGGQSPVEGIDVRDYVRRNDYIGLAQACLEVDSAATAPPRSPSVRTDARE